MSIENPTLPATAGLVHFRHFIRRGRFSSLFTNLPSTTVEYLSASGGALYKSTLLCKTNPILSAVGGLQMNVTSYMVRDYENIANWTLGENKPNTNPIRTQYEPNFKLEANLSLRERRSLRVSFSESSNRGPIKAKLAFLKLLLEQLSA